MPDPLDLEQVRRIARLARLHLSADELEAYRVQLSTVLRHMDRLQQVDVDGVEPMAHPQDLVNRLDEDVAEPSLPPEVVLGLAPAVESGFIAVPKVLPGDEP